MLKQTFYTLSEIAPKTPYSAEYLSLLARKGKLRAVKMDAAWMTTEDWVEEYQQSIAVTEPVSGVSAGGNYLSAAEAAEGTPYGSEYLALRIRQGKIRGEKINGRWHTRREWVEEYVAGISNPASNVRGLDTLDFGVRAAWKASAPLRRAAAADNARFYPTRLLAAGLTATIAFLFVAPPQVWAHWGVSASLAVTRSFDLGADGAARAARQLAANPRFTEPLSRVQAAARLGVMSLSLLNRTQHTASERLASRFGLDTAPRSGADAPFGGRDAFEQKGGPAAASVGAAAALGVGAGGQVAGAFGVRLLAPKTFSFSGALTRALALPGTSLKGAITFLNPNDLAVNLARLSGNAIEAGQSLAQLDLATGITQSVSQLSSRINAISILQPAGQYAVSLRGGVDAPGGRDADGQSVPAAEGVEAAPVFGPSRLGTSSDGTLMVGTLPLQAAANTFTNQNNP
ncbi:MAG: hypothetical protein HYT31_04505, partial [Parcubacteria group bacterium]|nr:hypothetical protein [Parcubacteria group bacterium]